MIPLKIWKYIRVIIQIFMQMLVCVFQKYLQNASDHHIQKIQDNVRLNLFLNTDFKK